MNSTPRIFKERLINKRLAHFSRDNIPDFETKFMEAKRWCNATAEKYLDRTKETAVQGAFMTRLFNQVFGYYEVIDAPCYNQTRESKTVLDSSESDGALGYFYKDTGKKDVRVVIELKDARTPLDKKQNRSSHLTPVEQAFSYANKNGSKCGWVIVSNFIETRLYKSNSMIEYETFDMRKMDDEKEFLRFYYFMCKDHLIAETGKSIIDELFLENETEGVAITNQFYSTYKEIRNNLFLTIKEINPGKDDLLLFTKAQKLMDRFIFICFCEDCDLLPKNIFNQVVENAKHSFSFSPYKLWDQLKGLFTSIDKGNPPLRINEYNGGLFKADEDLDSLLIPDSVLESFLQLSSYDFTSDLNVNILGQIFEQSISDVEQIKRELNGEDSSSKGKRKEDGIFYTPYYVTRYIVKQTVGVYLEQKKEELKQSLFEKGPVIVSVLKKSTKRQHEYSFSSWKEIPERRANMTEDEDMAIRAVERLHLKYWEAYENVLKEIKICDPACGSGAFLNQCFDYLHEEMDFVLDRKTVLNGAQFSMLDIDKDILQNNLYGVDLNPESVEITKLSLWLKTAKNNQTLASLDNNIKCGNSIIADKAITENGFDWQKEFPAIFERGGFDVIVGNPPYGASVSPAEKAFIAQNYSTFEGLFDTYKIFFELGIRLLKHNGFLGYITPNTYFELIKSGKKLRQFLFSNTLLKIIELYNVFPDAVVEPVISVYQKTQNSDAQMEIILVPRNTPLSSTFENEGIHLYKPQTALRRNNDYIFIYKQDDTVERILSHIQAQSQSLFHYCSVYNGAKPYCQNKGIPLQTKEMIANKIYNGYTRIDESWRKYYRGNCIKRFTDMWDGEYIKYGDNLAEPRDKNIFFREKLFVRQTGDTIIATLDKGNVSNNTLHIVFPNNITIDNKYLLGLLNSTLMNWVFQATHPTEVGKPMAEVKKDYLGNLPIVCGNESQQDSVISLVDALLSDCQNRFKKKQLFINYIVSTYEPKAITNKIESFEELSFKEFCDELKKQKVKLSASEKMDLLQLYNEITATISSMTAQIKQKQAQLDDIVFSIYNLSIEDIVFIKSKIAIEI